MDYTNIYNKAAELAKVIKNSNEYQEFITCQELMKNDDELQSLLHKFQENKEKFAEASQYGNYHPDLPKIKKDYQQIKIQLMANELFKKYKASEHALDLIIYEIESKLKSVVNIKEKHEKGSLKFI